MAQRAELPVQHGHHLGPRGVEHQVFEPEVAVRDAGVRRAIGFCGNVQRQPRDQAVHGLHRFVTGGVGLLGPAADQAAVVAVRAAKVLQAQRLPVGLVQRGQHAVGFHEIAGALGHRNLGQGGVAKDAAFHEVHHVERHADDRLILALGAHPRYRHGAALQRLQDAELALDGVGRGQQAGCWGRLGAQHPRLARAVQQPRRVGLAAVHALGAQRTVHARHARRQPLHERRQVQLGTRGAGGRRRRCGGRRGKGAGVHGVNSLSDNPTVLGLEKTLIPVV